MPNGRPAADDMEPHRDGADGPCRGGADRRSTFDDLALQDALRGAVQDRCAAPVVMQDTTAATYQRHRNTGMLPQQQLSRHDVNM